MDQCIRSAGIFFASFLFIHYRDPILVVLSVKFGFCIGYMVHVRPWNEFEYEILWQHGKENALE